MGFEEIRVGMGDIAVTQAPNTLAIIGLGSCVGVALYFPKLKIGGLAHIMLPDSTKARPGMSLDKYADTGLTIMLGKLRKMNVEPLFTTARLVGGASMFKTANNQGAFNIGENNVAACKEFLKREKIKVVGEEVLGNKGRTMRFDLETGKISVRFVDGKTLEL